MRASINKTRIMDFKVSAANPIMYSGGTYTQCAAGRYNMHFGLELGIVLSGLQRRSWPGYSRLVGRGQAWLAGIWEPHVCEVLKAPCEVFEFIIWPPLLTQLRFEEAPELKWIAPFVVPPSRRPRLTPAKQRIVFQEVERLKKMMNPAGPVEKAKVRISLLTILAQFLDNTNSVILKAKNDNFPKAHWDKLNHAAQLVFENRAYLSTARVAKECGLSRPIFSLLFKKWMGMRFADFALQFRLKQAAEALLNSDAQIKAVARQWGFVDISHFNHVFLKYYGYAPSRFRRK